MFDNRDLDEVYRGAHTGLGAAGQHILIVPSLDMVGARKTRPGQDRRVSHSEFLEVVDLRVQARCGSG